MADQTYSETQYKSHFVDGIGIGMAIGAVITFFLLHGINKIAEKYF